METKPTGDRSITASLQQLEHRLVMREGRISELRLTDETVNEICADYEACCSKLLKLEQTGEAATQQARDYRELRDQLERELGRHLAGVGRTAVGAEETSGQDDARS